MTALTEYDRLEASGLWRANAQDQRREVVVSIGDATLTITDFNNRALAHWSLAAIDRQNPGALPAIFNPNGDTGETLELGEDEHEMIDAIERLRTAVDRARPRPGRLRLVGVIVALLAMLGGTLFWLPDALMRHTLKVVPQIKRQEIGQALVTRLERVGGKACLTTDTRPVLTRLAQRTGLKKLIVLPTGVRETAPLPGGIVLINKALVEDHEDPSVLAGYLLAERARGQDQDPLAHVLSTSGPLASFRLLTTGELTQKILDDYAEQVLIHDTPLPSDDRLLALFESTRIASTPFAYAVDITGETTIGLIEADPFSRSSPDPVLPDRDWVLLQDICGG